MAKSDDKRIDIHMKFTEWLKRTGDYHPMMREAARRFRHHKMLNESTDPQTGVYFWIPLPGGKWDVVSFFDTVYGGVLHTQAWKREVLPYLSQVWKLNSQQVKTIRDAYTGLPRGRVSKMMPGYANYNGGDAPVSDKQANAIIKREFGLPSIRSIPDDHERMLQDDVNATQSVFGNLGLTGI
jgi:hypothetical protein